MAEMGVYTGSWGAGLYSYGKKKEKAAEFSLLIKFRTSGHEGLDRSSQQR